MKKLVISISLIMLTVFIFRCSNEKAIEETISAWEAAIEAKNASDLKETLSPDSDIYIQGDASINNFMNDYFSDIKDVEYSNLDIDVEQPYADVLPSSSTYTDNADLIHDVMTKFKMKKEEGLFSFISPDWRVYKYHDDYSGGFDNPIWYKLGIKKK